MRKGKIVFSILRSYFWGDVWSNFGIAFFSGIGTCVSLVGIYDLFFTRNGKLGVWYFIIPSICLGIGFFLWWGIKSKGFLRRKLSFDIATAKITVKFGDLFEQPGILVIGVNNFFDSEVGTSRVSKKSLHGIMLNKLWENNIPDWCRQINTSIESDKLLFLNKRPNEKHKDQYDIGTTAFVKAGETSIICVAIAETKDNFEAESSDIKLLSAVHGALSRGRTECNGSPLSFPLMGSGLARINLDHISLLNLILTAIVEEVREKKVTDEINVILAWDQMDKFDFVALQRLWK